MEQQRKYARSVSAGRRRTLQVELAGYGCILRAEELHRKIRKSQRTHAFSRRVALMIVAQNILISVLHSFSDERGFGRVIVPGHVRVDVTAVPSLGLIVQDAPDCLLRGIRAETTGSYQEKNECPKHTSDFNAGSARPTMREID